MRVSARRGGAERHREPVLSDAPSPQRVRVVAGALFDAAGRVLIAQRPEGRPMSGQWEFPGGKQRAQESGEQALGRELHEELGIRVRRCRRLLSLTHDYGERLIDLEVFLVEAYEGEPAGLESQALQWRWPHELDGLALLEADGPIVEALKELALGRATDDNQQAEVSEHGTG